MFCFILLQFILYYIIAIQELVFDFLNGQSLNIGPPKGWSNFHQNV